MISKQQIIGKFTVPAPRKIPVHRLVGDKMCRVSAYDPQSVNLLPIWAIHKPVSVAVSRDLMPSELRRGGEMNRTFDDPSRNLPAKIGAFLVGAADSLFRLFVVTKFYTWHVRPMLGTPPLSIWNVWVASGFASMLTWSQLTMYQRRERTPAESMWSSLACSLIAALLLLIAYEMHP